MTYQEFLDELEKTPRDWVADNGTVFLGTGCPPLIRRNSGCSWQCPISSLVGFPTNQWRAAAEEIGLSLVDAEAIQMAADGWNTRPDIRADLIRACGLRGLSS